MKRRTLRLFDVRSARWIRRRKVARVEHVVQRDAQAGFGNAGDYDHIQAGLDAESRRLHPVGRRIDFEGFGGAHGIAASRLSRREWIVPAAGIVAVLGAALLVGSLAGPWFAVALGIPVFAGLAWVAVRARRQVAAEPEFAGHPDLDLRMPVWIQAMFVVLFLVVAFIVTKGEGLWEWGSPPARCMVATSSDGSVVWGEC